MKQCSSCKETKDVSLFKQRKNGKIDSWCKSCYVKKSSEYYEKNKEKVFAYRKTENHKNLKSKWDKNYRERNKESLLEKKKLYYENNVEQHKKIMRENYQNNPQAYKNRAAQWRKNNRDLHNAQCMARYTTKMNRTFDWAKELTDLASKECYDKANRLFELTNIPHDVDHIVPLLGKTVSGFHVYTNLQVIPASDNRSKKNLYWPDQWERNKR